MRRLLKIIFFSLIFIFLAKSTTFAIIDHNSYLCSTGNYNECIVNPECWGNCGRSPKHQGEVPACPTGYRCFCETDEYNDGDGVLNECGCVECKDGCDDPFGYFAPRDACHAPTCEVNGHTCLPWGSECEEFDPGTFSCTWYDEACCTRLGNNQNCMGLCEFPGKMFPFPDNFDPDNESTYCPAGYKYSDLGGKQSRLCVITKGDDIIGGSACCLNDTPCPGMCSASRPGKPACPPEGRPDLNGVSLEYACDEGEVCCVENVVKQSCPTARGASCVKSTASGDCPDGYVSFGDFDCGEGYACCVGDDKGPPRDAAYRGPVIDSLEKILGPVVKILYYGGLMLGIFYIIISGYKLMVSQGNPQQTQDAQEQLTAAILGIIFILLSVTILRVILGKVMGITM